MSSPLGGFTATRPPGSRSVCRASARAPPRPTSTSVGENSARSAVMIAAGTARRRRAVANCLVSVSGGEAVPAPVPNNWRTCTPTIRGWALIGFSRRC